METQPIVIGVQAPIGKSDDLSIQILGSPGCPNSGGFNAVRFPDGAELMGWDWQSSIKGGWGKKHEVLFQLRMTVLSGEETILLSTHHIGTWLPTMVTKQDKFDCSISIPSGGIIWIYGEGWMEKRRPAGAEVQTTLFVHGPVKWEIYG